MYIFIYIYMYIITYNVITYVITLNKPLVWRKSLGIHFLFSGPHAVLRKHNILRRLENVNLLSFLHVFCNLQIQRCDKQPQKMPITPQFHQNHRVMDRERNIFLRSWPHPAFFKQFFDIFSLFLYNNNNDYRIILDINSKVVPLSI